MAFDLWSWPWPQVMVRNSSYDDTLFLLVSFVFYAFISHVFTNIFFFVIGLKQCYYLSSNKSSYFLLKIKLKRGIYPGDREAVLGLREWMIMDKITKSPQEVFASKAFIGRFQFSLHQVIRNRTEVRKVRSQITLKSRLRVQLRDCKPSLLVASLVQLTVNDFLKNPSNRKYVRCNTKTSYSPQSTSPFLWWEKENFHSLRSHITYHGLYCKEASYQR